MSSPCFGNEMGGTEVDKAGCADAGTSALAAATGERPVVICTWMNPGNLLQTQQSPHAMTSR